MVDCKTGILDTDCVGNSDDVVGLTVLRNQRCETICAMVGESCITIKEQYYEYVNAGDVFFRWDAKTKSWKDGFFVIGNPVYEDYCIDEEAIYHVHIVSYVAYRDIYRRINPTDPTSKWKLFKPLVPYVHAPLGSHHLLFPCDSGIQAGDSFIMDCGEYRLRNEISAMLPNFDSRGIVRVTYENGEIADSEPCTCQACGKMYRMSDLGDITDRFCEAADAEGYEMELNTWDEALYYGKMCKGCAQSHLSSIGYL